MMKLTATEKRLTAIARRMTLDQLDVSTGYAINPITVERTLIGDGTYRYMVCASGRPVGRMLGRTGAESVQELRDAASR